MPYEVEKPDEQWRAELTAGVPRPARGRHRALHRRVHGAKTKGVYSCRACGADLAPPALKFRSPTAAGRPSTTRRTPTPSNSWRTARTAWSAPRSAAPAAAPTWGTSSRARATRPRRTSGTASTRCRCGWCRTRSEAARAGRPNLGTAAGRPGARARERGCGCGGLRRSARTHESGGGCRRCGGNDGGGECIRRRGPTMKTAEAVAGAGRRSRVRCPVLACASG